MARFMPQYQMPDASLMLVDYSPMVQAGHAIGQGLRDIGNNMRQSRREKREDERWQQEFQAQQEHRQWQRQEATAEREATEDYREAMVWDTKLRTGIQAWTAVQDNRRAIKAEAGRQKLLDLNLDKARLELGMSQEEFDASKRNTAAGVVLGRMSHLTNSARAGNPVALAQLESVIDAGPMIVERFPDVANRFGINKQNLSSVQDAMRSHRFLEEARANVNNGWFRDKATGKVYRAYNLSEQLRRDPSLAEQIDHIPATVSEKALNSYYETVDRGRDSYGSAEEFVKQNLFGMVPGNLDEDPMWDASVEEIDEAIKQLRNEAENKMVDVDTGLPIDSGVSVINYLDTQIEALETKLSTDASLTTAERTELSAQISELDDQKYGLLNSESWHNVTQKERMRDLVQNDHGRSVAERVKSRIGASISDWWDEGLLGRIGQAGARLRHEYLERPRNDMAVTRGANLGQMIQAWNDAVAPEARQKARREVDRQLKAMGLPLTKIEQKRAGEVDRRYAKEIRTLQQIRNRKMRSVRPENDRWADIQKGWQDLKRREMEMKAREKGTASSANVAGNDLQVAIERFREANPDDEAIQNMSNEEILQHDDFRASIEGR